MSDLRCQACGTRHGLFIERDPQKDVTVINCQKCCYVQFIPEPLNRVREEEFVARGKFVRPTPARATASITPPVPPMVKNGATR